MFDVCFSGMLIHHWNTPVPFFFPGNLPPRTKMPFRPREQWWHISGKNARAQQGPFTWEGANKSTVVDWSLELETKKILVIDSMFFIEKKSFNFASWENSGRMETWLFSAAGNVTKKTDFSKVSLSQTLGFTIPFISLHPWNHPNKNPPGLMGQFSSHLRVDPKLLKVAKERAIHATSQALLFNYHVLGYKPDQSTATAQVDGGQGDDSNYSQPEFSVKLELEKTTSKKWEKD